MQEFIFCEIPGVLLHRLERNGVESSGFFCVGFFLFLLRRIFSCDGLIEDEIR